jgi:uncharacterized protein YlxP (DUF503 family)
LKRLEVRFFETRSLKDKRSVLARFRTELRKLFNVSVAGRRLSVSLDLPSAAL